MRLAFRALEPADLGLVRSWLEDPGVHRWWHQETTPEAMDREFGSALRGERAVEHLLVLLDGEEVGLVQRYLLRDHPEDRDLLGRCVEVPSGAAGIDYLLGQAHHRGRGLGPRAVEAAVADLFARYDDATCVLVPVAGANRASWRALEKAGFRFVGECDLPPDNPADESRHVVYRRDRPGRAVRRTGR